MSKYWEFNKATSEVMATETGSLLDEEKQFKFKLTRYKDSISHEESLKIESFYAEEENGFIITSVYNLEQDIKKLMQYGVVFSDVVYAGLRMEIRKVYLQLTKTPPEDELSDKTPERKDTLIEALGTYTASLEAKEGLYCIQVSEFNSIALDCGYSSIELRSLKNMMMEDGYIKELLSGGITRLTKIKNKPVRVLYLNADMFAKSTSMDSESNDD